VTRAILVLSVLVAAGACRNAAKGDAKGAGTATLVFGASVAGELMPCGCSPDQLGGLPRAVALVNQLRKAQPNLAYVDAGDLLLAGAPTGYAAQQAELKARTLGKGGQLLGAAARALGARDLALGPQLASDTAFGVPLLDAGGAQVRSASASHLVKAGEVPIGVFAAGLGAEPAKAIAERAAALRAQGARLIVLLYHPPAGGPASWTQAQQILPAAQRAGVDLVVLGHRDDPTTDANQALPGAPPLLAVQGHMQYLLAVELTFPEQPKAGEPVFLSRGAAGKEEALKRFDERIARLQEQAAAAASPERKKLYLDKIAEQQGLRAKAASAVEAAPAGAVVATARFLPIDGKAGEDLQAKAVVAAYDDAVAAMNLEAAKAQPESGPPAAQGEASYLGVVAADAKAESCAACHKTQTEFWARTNHAHAYATLVKARKEFSLDCVRCHVTGWQQPGGVCRIDRTAAGGPGFSQEGRRFGQGRQDVQCEACHGPGSEHVADPPGHIRAQVDKTVCLRCHEAANSPHFDYPRYLPFVVGPGHGQPLPEGQKPGPVGAGPHAPAAPAEGKP
jgi:hypothetical protein